MYYTKSSCNDNQKFIDRLVDQACLGKSPVKGSRPALIGDVS